MGRIYLNSAMKSVVITLGAYIDFLEGLVDTYEKTKKPTPLLKSLRTSKTWGLKALRQLLEGVHPDEIEKLVGREQLDIMQTNTGIIKWNKGPQGGEINKMEVVVRYKDQAIREALAMQKLDSVSVVDSGDLMNIISLAIASCNLCELKGQDVEGCKYRKLFLKYEAEPVNCNPGDGCPYRK